MKTALAQLRFPQSIDDGLSRVEAAIREASAAGADIVCFPETYLPGLRAAWMRIDPPDPPKLAEALDRVCGWARSCGIHVLMPMEWPGPGGLLNTVFVIDRGGNLQGRQDKVHLDPSEDSHYVPGRGRRMFQADGVPFAISICHEGFRYPETVRWAALHGAAVVFQPFFGGERGSRPPRRAWGDAENPYNERAVQCRALENTLFMASVNYALPYQDAATAAISPDGVCLGWLQYGAEQILYTDMDPALATRTIALRFRPDGLAGEGL